MAGKSGSSSKHASNTTGKAGNASGSPRREARGDAAGRTGRGKHPPNKMFRSPQSDRAHARRIATGPGKRQSDRGDNPAD